MTRLRLQPFLVTLCGLFMYRGAGALARPRCSVQHAGATECPKQMRMAAGQRQRLRHTAHVCCCSLLIAALLAVVLHGSVYGRYLYAIGYNEQAARYAGIPTDRYKILAYIICSTLAGLGGVLFLLLRTARPSLQCGIAAGTVCDHGSGAGRL